jgi:hypothetical protein
VADLDRELSARLSRLAAAVPVAPGRLDPVHRGAVEARQRVRLARLTPLVALVVAVTAFGLLEIKPFAPGASPSPMASGRTPEASDVSARPVVATDVEGPYSLELRSSRTVYLANEPIDLRGTFVYSGDHDIAVRYFWPHTFRIREQVHGLTLLAAHPITMHYTPCPPILVLRPGERYEGTFAISGFSPSPPSTEEQRAFLADPELRLPPGTWHLQVRAEVIGGGSCGANATTAPPAADTKLDAEIEIVVVPAPEPSHPSIVEPTSAPEATEPPPFPSPLPVRGTAPIDIHVDDELRLTLEAGDSVFRAGDPIQVEARYAYIGSPLNATVAHFEPEVAYSIRQLEVPALIYRSQVYDSACTQQEMRAGIEQRVPLRHANLMTIEARSLPGDFDDKLAAGILALPAGQWRISASLHPLLGGCQGEERDLIAWIDITVVPPGWSRVPIITASEPASACHLARHEGRIAPNAESGIGTAGSKGTTFSVRWPYGWSGWRDADGVVLLDATGAVVAREGDNVVMGGGIGADVDFYACTGIEEPGPQ